MENDLDCLTDSNEILNEDEELEFGHALCQWLVLNKNYLQLKNLRVSLIFFPAILFYIFDAFF